LITQKKNSKSSHSLSLIHENTYRDKYISLLEKTIEEKDILLKRYHEDYTALCK